MSRNHRGKRSVQANLYRKQVTLARSFTYKWAYQDRIIRETVCTKTKNEVESFIKEQCAPDEPRVVFIDPYIDGVILYSQLEEAYWDGSKYMAIREFAVKETFQK